MNITLNRYVNPETCEVCGKTASSAEKHPCRFEKACACWYGVPCKRGEGIRQYDRERKAN